MADMVTVQELENAKIDAKTIGESVNENKIVTPRYGAPFKSMPMIAEEMQSLIGTIIAGGIPANIVADARNISQQEINDQGLTYWRDIPVTGYKLNSRAMLENGDIVKSLISNNTTNPNTNMTGWVNVSLLTSTSYDYLTQAKISGLKDGTLTENLTSTLQSLLTSSANTVIIKDGTYLIDAAGIVLSGIKNKKVIFEKGASLKWHPLVTFASNTYMIRLTDCKDIEFVNPQLAGANDPLIWVEDEKVLRAGLVDKQTALFHVNCENIKFISPVIKNFQFGIYTLSSGANKSKNIKIIDGYFTGNFCGIVWESYVVDGITDCEVRNTISKKNWKWGMWMESGDLSKDGRYIQRIKVIGGDFSNQVEEHGVYVQGQDHSFVGVSFVSNNTAGLRMLSCGGLQVIGCKFKDNGWNRNRIGYLAGAAFIGDDTSTYDIYKRANNVVFSNNISDSNRFTFVDYKLDNGVIVSNNTCYNNGATGVDGDIVFRSNQNSKILNNVIRDSKCDVGILVRDQGNSLCKNIDIFNNQVTRQSGIGIKYQWGASETDSEMIRIIGNTVNGCTSHGILAELNTRETQFVEITGNNTRFNGGAGIRTYLGVAATCTFLRVSENSSTHNTSYGIHFDGVSGGIANGLYEKNNHVQRNNSNLVQTYQNISGGAAYATNQLVQSGMRRTVTFSLKDVTVAASGEIQLNLDGLIPYHKLAVSVRVKSIEFYSSKMITGGSLSASVRAYTGVGTGANMLSSALTATINAGQQDKSISNAMNASTDRILLGARYYVGVDMSNTVVSGGRTIDLVCKLVLDYSDDWRFEVAL